MVTVLSGFYENRGEREAVPSPEGFTVQGGDRGERPSESALTVLCCPHKISSKMHMV